MAGSPFKLVNFTSREEVLTADIIRAQKLSSKALQDELRAASLDSSGVAINTFSVVPTLTGVAATMTMTLGDGECLATFAGDADDSAYYVLSWSGLAAGFLSFANPDGANPRIDLVVAAPGSVASDVFSRNILVDPVARTVTSAGVAKTLSPTPTLAVVTGTAAANPAAPAVPGGAVALFEVLVPAAAADATTFVPIQRMFRRASYPLTGGIGHSPQTGILRGCKLSHAATFESLSNADNAVVIDGEVIEFGSITDLNFNDAGGANPFAGAAPAGNDVPYYIYVVGGRNLPSVNSLTAPAQPVIMIASLTAPNVVTGRPSAPITAPRGTTSSACYVGMGFVLKNTTSRQRCRAVGDMIWCATVTGADLGFEATAAFAVGTNNVTFASAPTIADQIVVGLTPHTGAAGLMTLGLNATMQGWSKNYGAGVGTIDDGLVELPINAGAGPHLVNTVSGAANTLLLEALAYKMNVRRFG